VTYHIVIHDPMKPEECFGHLIRSVWVSLSLYIDNCGVRRRAAAKTVHFLLVGQARKFLSEPHQTLLSPLTLII
jgi:hypothetical protein